MTERGKVSFRSSEANKMSRNGKADDRRVLDMPAWMVALVIGVMLLIAILAFWHSARISYESLPSNQSAVAR